MDAKLGDTTLDLDLNWTNNDVHGLDIEDAALPLSDEILIPSTPNRVVRWLSSHPRLWLVTCTIIPLLLALVGVTYRVEVDLGLSSFQVRDHISYRALESYIAAVKLHRTLLLNMASTYMSDYHSPSHDLHESTRHVRSVNAGRYEKLWTFHIIFSLNEQSTQVNATIFSAGHVLYMHHVIQQLTAIPEYTAACWLRGDTCHSPGSLLSELMDGDVLRADWSVRLAALREKGVFWYTDEHFPETGRSTMTRVELYLGGPLYGYESKTDRASEQYDTLLPVVVTLRNTLRHVTSDAPIDVHWGGDAITGYEIRETVFGDAQYALGSLLLVAVLVFVQLRSPFLAMYAVYELLIAFPAVYGVYMYACQLESVNLLTGVALFLVIGIGVDDVFVFYFSYQHARTHYPDAPAHRLAYTYQHAMLATFVTSLTTAAAFLANLFSQIPALRMFGIYMSLIVMMNWLLSVTLFPAALVTWDSHVRAKEQKIVRCVAPFLKRKKSFKRNNFNQKLGQCLSSHVYTLRYLYLAIFAVLTAGAVYQSLSLEGASAPPQVFQHNSNLGWFSEWQRSGWVPDMTGATSWTPSKPANHTNMPPATPHAPHAMTPVTWTPVTHTSAPVMRTPTGVVTPVTQKTPHTSPTTRDSSDSEPPVPPSINNIDVQIVWGLTGHVNGSHVNPRDPFSEWIGIPERDLQFDPLTTACIDHLANVCDTLMQRGLLASPGRCLLSAFKDKLTAAGKWPLNDRNAMLYHLLLFIRTNIEEYQSDFSLNHFNWTDIKTRLALQQPLDLQVIWLRYAFRSNTSRSISSRDAVALYNEWQSVLDELDRSAPRECRGALQFSDTWIEALTETTLVDNIVSSLFTSLVVALGTLLLFVGNVLTAFLALVTLAVNLFLTLGAFKLLGWTLGAVESLCMTLLVGLSVDYVLHLAHAYTQAARRAPLQSRQVLLSTAIQSMGTAILSGAITTIASTAMLLMCQIVIFIKFGAIICLTLLTALLLTTLLFPALVLVFGPRSGDSCDMYVLCRTMMRCGRSALTQNDFALLQHDEQHALMNHVDATY